MLSSLSLFSGAGLLPGWLVLSLVIQIIRERTGLAGFIRTWLFGLVAYMLLLSGLWLVVGTEILSAIVGMLLLLMGHAGLFGWAVSPAGTHFLYVPVGVICKRWPASVSASECQALWSRSSSCIAIVVLGVDVVILLCIRMVF